MECEACLHSFIFKLVITESFEYLVTLYYPFLYSFSQILSIFQPSQWSVEQTVRSKIENENRQIENGKDKMETSK